MIINLNQYLNNLPNRKFLLGIILILLIGLNSCVSTKPARTINKAENRIIKLNEGIQNQIERYPSLVNKAYIKTERIPVYIPADSSQFKLQLLQIDSLTNLTDKYLRDSKYNEYLVDSLLNLPLQDYPAECQFIVNDLQNRISLLGTQYKKQQELTNQWQSNYLRIINTPITGIYEDSVFHIRYSYQNGEIDLYPKVKERYQVVDVETVKYDINIKKHFWQDFKFYIFLIFLITLFYLFGDFIFGLIKKGLSLLRKLIFKI